MLDASGFASRYLPAYSQDLNPIRESWTKCVHRAAARTASALYEALGRALDASTTQDAHGSFKETGDQLARPK